MQKIGLIGLYSIDNMGDCLICETTRFILGESTQDVEVIEIDAAPRKISSYRGFYKLNLLVSAFLIRVLLPLLAQTVPRSMARYYFERFAWRLKLQWHYKTIIPTCDALIFSGGGFLKFKNQGLNYLVEQVVEICALNDIPVMLSGVGIEGFDRHDYRCEKLGEALRSPAIRTITTRDFLEILQDDYGIGLPTHTSLVGDPAFWVPECYDAKKKEDSSKIGINVIRKDIYKDYGNHLSAQELKSFYMGMISTLDEKGADWVLFSNGMTSDHDFGVALLQEMNLSPSRMLPPPRTAHEMITVVSQFGVILGARMHACISAYSLDIPVVGLIWNEKLTRFSEITRQRHMFFAENELNTEKMCMKLLDVTNCEYDDGLRRELKKKTQTEIEDFLRSLKTST